VTSVGSTHRLPKFHQHSTRPSLIYSPGFALFKGGDPGARRAAWMSENKGQRLAGITNSNGLQISRCFSALRKRRRVPWKIACSSLTENPGSPLRLPAIQLLDTLRTSQDCGSSTAQSPKAGRKIAYPPLSEKIPAARLVSGDSMLKYVRNVAGLWLKWRCQVP